MSTEFSNDAYNLCRQAVSNVTQGRAITRLVSLFETAEALVHESDRRRALQAEGSSEDDDDQQSVEHTLE